MCLLSPYCGHCRPIPAGVFKGKHPEPRRARRDHEGALHTPEHLALAAHLPSLQFQDETEMRKHRRRSLWEDTECWNREGDPSTVDGVPGGLPPLLPLGPVPTVSCNNQGAHTLEGGAQACLASGCW